MARIAAPFQLKIFAARRHGDIFADFAAADDYDAHAITLLTAAHFQLSGFIDAPTFSPIFARLPPFSFHISAAAERRRFSFAAACRFAAACAFMRVFDDIIFSLISPLSGLQMTLPLLCFRRRLAFAISFIFSLRLYFSPGQLSPIPRRIFFFAFFIFFAPFSFFSFTAAAGWPLRHEPRLVDFHAIVSAGRHVFTFFLRHYAMLSPLRRRFFADYALFRYFRYLMLPAIDTLLLPEPYFAFQLSG